ncbi:MAG TPA: PilZ domain-containing protein [Candidatus Angelobacter sp.]|nr:PilZ domain-containing protein [Candidatus Angelobacter sp.]
MTKHSNDDSAANRKFERVDIAYSSQVLVLDAKGKKVGVLRQLGRGGFMMEPDRVYLKDTKTHRFIIHEQHEDIRAQVTARVRYADPRFAGFEFVDLDADTAVELGIIIGKYYED